MLKKRKFPKLKKNVSLISLLFFFIQGNIFSQSFTPVAVTGFNHDVIAESGTSSLTTTTIPLDGVTVSNKVMYNVTFRTTNGFGGGGIPDNGTIADAAGSYQLAPYTGSNALLLQRTQTGDLTLTTPAKFNSVRVLCFSTEGVSAVNVTLTFTDATTTSVLTNYALADWFNGNTNLVLSGFGRCTRATPASGADAFPTNPRFYYINIPISCVNKEKLLQKISFTNVTTAGTNAPYPNAVFFAVSGIANTQTVTPAITNATCAANGSATLTLNGFTAPTTVSWNTVPVQTGTSATNLQPGNYQASITDGNGCVTVFPVTITLTNNLNMTAHADTSICPGAGFNANTISNAANYSWSPTTGVSNPAIANPVLSPATTTTYTITGTTGACSIARSFTVTVQSTVTLTVHADTSICPGSSFNANTVSNATTYSWSPTTGVSNPAIANPVLSPATTTTYTLTASTGNCTNIKSFKVTVLPAVTVNAGPGSSIFEGSAVQLQGSGSAGTYLWTPATGLSATNILDPVAKPLVTTTYTLRITNAQGCSNTSSVTITVIPYCVKPLNAFTPNNDGFNDKWLITNGNCLKKAKVQVYNRYGGKVFESQDYKNDWDGTYKGKPVADGTYYYVIDYELINNTTVLKKGNVTILR
jgi:gliding motility-associated-like protein